MSKDISHKSSRRNSAEDSSTQLSFSRLWVEAHRSRRGFVPAKTSEQESLGSDGMLLPSVHISTRYARSGQELTERKEMSGRSPIRQASSGQDLAELDNLLDAPPAQTIPRLRELLNRNWPEAAYGGRNGTAHRFRIHLPALAAIFPQTGIPYGQLIEISGGISSGKTTLQQKILGAIEPVPRIGYLDFSCSFFPPGAEIAGIDLQRLRLLRPGSLQDGLRAVEALLQLQQINCVVFDLVGINEPLPRILLHRLRQNIVRAEAIGFFLTETGSRHLPASYTSMRLQTERAPNNEIEITAARGRIGREGAHGRMNRV